jgi:hypothetical protein
MHEEERLRVEQVNWVPVSAGMTLVGPILNEVKGINRAVYDVTSKPPGTIEWE